MATVRSISMKGNETILSAALSEDEHELLKALKHVLIFPEEFDEHLTTGRLGNSNRVMLPKKVLKKHGIELEGNVPAKIFGVNGKKFLLIRIEDVKIGVPKFRE